MLTVSFCSDYMARRTSRPFHSRRIADSPTEIAGASVAEKPGYGGNENGIA
jgi:hypothetical protein